jgi:predicted nucleotidyltransferase
VHLADEETERQVVRLCAKYGVKELYTFGMEHPGELCQQDDIEMAVIFSRAGVTGSFDQYFDFKTELEQACNRPVTLVCYNAVRSNVLRHEINQMRKLVYMA